MAITYIKTGIATLEFEAQENILDGTWGLSICAYGDFWGESFSNYEDMKKYLKENWHLSDEQIEKIKENKYDERE